MERHREALTKKTGVYSANFQELIRYLTPCSASTSLLYTSLELRCHRRLQGWAEAVEMHKEALAEKTDVYSAKFQELGGAEEVDRWLAPFLV